jgi:hypothetical protein
VELVRNLRNRLEEEKKGSFECFLFWIVILRFPVITLCDMIKCVNDLYFLFWIALYV